MYDTVSEAYLAVLREVWTKSDHECRPRGMWIREKLNYSFSIDRPSAKPIETHDLERNKVIAQYTEAEKALYRKGVRSAATWSTEASKFWSKIANPDGTVNSNYGWMTRWRRIVPKVFESAQRYGLIDGTRDHYDTAWDWAVKSLAADRDSRQAFVHFNTPDFQWYGNKDQPCTMHMQYFIREDRLSATTVMRSQDVVKGLAYDLPWFCSQIYEMQKELVKYDVVVDIGTYTHFVGSMHAYLCDEPTILKMLGD